MAYQPVPNTVQVAFLWVGNGVLQGCEAQMQLYITGATAPTSANVLDIANQAATQHNAVNLGMWVSSAWTADRVIAQSLHVEGGPRSEVAVNAAGARAGTPCPPNCAMLIQFRAASGGAESRGRIYLPVGVETDLNGNDWDQSFVNSVVTEIGDVINALELEWAGSAQTVVSRYDGTTDVVRKKAVRRPGNALTTAVAAVSGRREVASQRNRRASV